jgi:iron complex transport system ATP-binding protein
VLRKEREKGKQILLVMHDLTRALSIADRVLVLDENTLVFDGTPDACIDAHVPERIFSLTRYDATDENGNTVRFFQ